MNFFATIFRAPDGRVHIVAANRVVRRNRGHRALCATPFDGATQTLAPHSVPGRSAVVTCDRCLRSFTGLADLCDRAADLPPDPVFDAHVADVRANPSPSPCRWNNGVLVRTDGRVVVAH